jgi:hypothetical protein
VSIQGAGKNLLHHKVTFFYYQLMAKLKKKILLFAILLLNEDATHFSLFNDTQM